ncbi:tetratricopeptide repeat-containing sensor histidine kinase [Flexibacter flexilis]|uniref:tetratricopeptide repeat-containing sensor histidine kinase n=1 Tax=Flexibacter flexilis TaxID=998 RepID=UPI000B8099E0|nr:sensor histidine kinase [Flexibacter flexilis]
MKKILIISFLLWSVVVLAQPQLTIEEFGQLSGTQQRIDFMADSNMLRIDWPTYQLILKDIQAKNDPKAEIFWHYQCVRHLDYFQKSEIFNQEIEVMLRFAQENDLKAELVIAQFYKTLRLFGGGELTEQQAYSEYLNGFEQIKFLGVEAFRDYNLFVVLHEIGRNFYQLGDNEKALETLLLAEKVAKKGTHFQTLILNLIESIYADKKDYPNAIIYAKKIYALNLTNKFSSVQDPKNWYPIFWQGLALLDLAQYEFALGNFAEGETYADQGYKRYQAQEDVNDQDKVIAAFDALQVLIKIKLKLGKLREVEPLLKKVEFLKQHINFSEDINYFKPLRFYQNYTSYYEAKKDYTNAYRYMKLASQMEDSLKSRNDKRTLWQTEMRVKASRYQEQIRSVEEDSRVQQQLRNVVIAGLVVLTIFGLVFYLRIRKDNKTISEQKTMLEKSLVEKETLLKEIHHRVKNNLQIISGLFDKQARVAKDETTKRLMREGQDRVFSIALVHQNLYQSENLATIEMKSYLKTLVKNIEKSQKSEYQNIRVVLEIDETVVDIDTAIPLGLILNELITNCYKYAFADRMEGEMKIQFSQQINEITFSVADDGVGLPADFDIQKTRSLGMNLVRGLVRQLGGKLTFTSSESGTIFTIYCLK